MIIQPHSKLLFIGDSITDCDRARPIGEGLFDALGKGYVGFVDSLLTVNYPRHRLKLVNMGVSGNTVRELKSRWQTDVLDLNPDWLVVFIGINDVWRQFHSPSHPEWHVSLAEYRETLDDLLSATRLALQGLILMTPYFIEPNPAEPMRAMMDQYGRVIKELAVTHEAVLVDTQAAFDAILSDLHPMALAWDRVHPLQSGHMLLAQSFLQAIDEAIKI